EAGMGQPVRNVDGSGKRTLVSAISVGERLSWGLENPILFEWEEPGPWGDRAAIQAYEMFLGLARVLAFRAVPTGLLLFALGRWLIGKIPDGGGVPPLSLFAKLAGLFLGPFLVEALFIVLLMRPKLGQLRQIRFRQKGLEVRGSGGMEKK